MPGCKVLRWERDWHSDGQPFVDPATYPARSAALTGTHDTETLAGWWTNAGSDERVALTQLLSASLPDASFDSAAPWSDSLRDAILTVMYRSASEELFFPVQDLFGWFHRINVPATVGEHNWTWKLPWPVDALAANDTANERQQTLRRLSEETDRSH